MLKKAMLCSLLFLPLSVHAEELNKNHVNGDLNWSLQSSWNLPAKPLAFAQTIDNKKVFILTADSRVRIFTPEGKQLAELPVDAGVSNIDIAPRGEMLYLLNTKTNSFSAIDISFNRQIDLAGAPILGKEDAPITLVVFSDFQCPFCSKAKPVLDKILADNKDTVRVVFKHLPLRMHPQAEPAARAAIAAQNQGKFWQMHDALFQLNEADWQKSTVIEETAAKIGLDMDKFKAESASEATRMKLAKDLMDAQAAEVMATPSMFINGRPVKERSPQAIQQIINEVKAGPTSQTEAKKGGA